MQPAPAGFVCLVAILVAILIAEFPQPAPAGFVWVAAIEIAE